MIYESQCKKCKRIHEYSARVDDRRKDAPRCCGTKTVLGIFTPPMVGAMSWTGWKGTMVNGKWMESGSDYKAYMKKNNMISLDEGKQEAASVRKAQKKKYEADLTKTVERVVHEATS